MHAFGAVSIPALMTLSNGRCALRSGLALVAAGLLTLTAGSAVAQEKAADMCDVNLLQLEAPKVRLILEEAAEAERAFAEILDQSATPAQTAAFSRPAPTDAGIFTSIPMAA